MKAAILGGGYLPLFRHRAGAAPLFEPRRRRRACGCGASAGSGTATRATAGGPDRRRLEEIARERRLGACRHRPPRSRDGAPSACCSTRPGLAAGAVLFLLLVRALGGLVWCIDLRRDGHRPARPPCARLLADCGIHEGVYLTKAAAAGRAGPGAAPQRGVRLGQPELYRRLPCRSRARPSQTQTVREPPPRQGLYASRGRGNTRR